MIRWITYPTESDSEFGVTVSAGAGFGTYLGLALALIVTFFGVRADAIHDKVLTRFFAASRGPGDRRPPPRD